MSSSESLPPRPLVARATPPRAVAPKAYLFDLDGVLTPTSEIHRRAWKRTFDEYFAHLAWNGKRDIAPLTDADYFTHIDGRPRYEGVRAVLESRGLQLPDRLTGSGPGFDTVEGLGDLKDEEFKRLLRSQPLEPYRGTVELLDRLGNMSRAVVSSSANARGVLEAAGILTRFAVVVDAVVAELSGLPGKPAPDTFLHAAALLGVSPEESCVLEDAVSGVAAARAGGFGLVVGVDRGAGESALLAAGADFVITELDQLLADGFA